MEALVFNPEYHLRQDGNRVILFSNDNVSQNSQEWFSFIHPFQAMMLSFFDGTELYENQIGKCARFFSLTEEDMHKIIKRFVNNEHWFGLSRKNKTTALFPKNVLLECNVTRTSLRDETYSYSDFQYDGEPDLKSVRLFFPLSINMELTMRCQTNCIYCYANRNLKDKQLLSLEEIRGFIKQAKQGGVYNLDINGGEVMLHPNIKEILFELVQNGYRPLISTKMPLDKDTIDYIKKLKNVKLQFSLDSADPEILHKMIGVTDGYLQNLSSTLEYLSTIGFPVKINVVLTKYNSGKSCIDSLLQFLSKFDAVSEVRFNPCGCSLYKSDFNEQILSAKQMLATLKYIEEQKGDYGGFAIKFSSFDKREDFDLSQKSKLFKDRALCTGGTRNAVLLPNGDITLCEELYDHPAFILGNIKNNSLSEIWNSRKAINLFQSPVSSESNSACRQCPQLSECRTGDGVCWKMVLLSYGMDKWDFPDPRCPKAPQPYNRFYYE